MKSVSRGRRAAGAAVGALAIGWILVGFGGGPVSAAVLLVPGQYSTIQAAVNAAVAGDVVQIAAGTYTDVTHPAGGGDPTLCIVVMKSGITLRGYAWEGTILDAGNLGRGIDCNGVSDVVIEKLTVRNAKAGSDPNSFPNAAIHCKGGSSITIQDCSLSENQTTGITCTYGASPLIQRCRISNNWAATGGGLYLYQSPAQVVSCDIEYNNTTGGGAGVRAESSNPAFTDCTIFSNATTQEGAFGGGFYFAAGSASLTNCTIQQNSALGMGGGIYAGFCQLTVTNCRIASSNGANGTGAALEMCGGSVLQDCTFVNNLSGFPGGGLWASGCSSLTIRQCTFAGNEGDHGSNVCIDPSEGPTNGTLEKSIIAFGKGTGKGIECSGDLIISCCDIYGNQGGDQLSCVDGGNNFSMDPMFCSLPYPALDCRLRIGSPCLPGSGFTQACGNQRIGGEDDCGPTGVEPTAGPWAQGGGLQSVPNPFGGSTVLKYRLDEAVSGTLRVFDASGREVRTLENGLLASGEHRVIWDGRDATGGRVPNGVYFYRLLAGGTKEMERVVLVR